MIDEDKELKESYYFNKLSPELKEEFLITLIKLNKSITWGLLALSLSPNNDWEKYRFGLFYKDYFQKEVNKAFNYGDYMIFKGSEIRYLQEVLGVNNVKEKFQEILDKMVIEALAKRGVDNAEKSNKSSSV